MNEMECWQCNVAIADGSEVLDDGRSFCSEEHVNEANEPQPTSPNKFSELTKAKANVKWLLDNSDGLADMHGLAYWAAVVERLRTEIKAQL